MYRNIPVKNHRNSGFTLVETIVSLGVLAIVIGTMLVFQSTIHNNSNQSQVRNNFFALAGKLNQRLSFSDLCAQSIGPASTGLGGTPAVFLPTDDSDGNGTPDWMEVRGKEIVIAAPNLQSGVTAAGTTAGAGTLFPTLGLRLDRLYVSEAVAVPGAAAGAQTYLAKVFMTASGSKTTSGGFSFKPILVSGLRFTVSTVSGSLVTCSGTLNAHRADACLALGCTYDPNLSPDCQCVNYLTGCAKPGEYPVGISGGKFVCEPLGDPNSSCPAGEILTGVGLKVNRCLAYTAAPAPTPPAPLPVPPTPPPAPPFDPWLPTDPSDPGLGCFVAGTQIRMADGSEKSIENIKVGDKLLNINGEIISVKKLKRYKNSGRKYSINGGRYFFTPNHPFMTLSGWKAIDVAAARKEHPNDMIGQMTVGDWLIHENGLELIESLDYIYSDEPVYNFEVDGHEYLADGYQVHNIFKF